MVNTNVNSQEQHIRYVGLEMRMSEIGIPFP